MDNQKLVDLLVELFEFEDVEIERVDNNGYGVEVVLDDGSEYYIMNEDEAYQYAYDSHKDLVSYFNPTFLSNMTGIDVVVFDKLVDEPEAVLSIVESTCGYEYLMDEAIALDGLGHFISSYDDVQTDLDGEYSAYPLNLK